MTQFCHNAFWSDSVLCCLYNTGERSFEVKTEAVINDVTEHYKPECSRQFTMKKCTKMHRKSYKGEKWHSCSQCEKRYSAPSTLSHHMNIHRGKHKCTECGRCCQSSQHLAEHRRCHSGEKPYSCGVCEKRFTSSTGLCIHMNIHRGKYKCTECGRCCGSKRDLALHRRCHSGEKPFECGECEKRFSSRSGLCLHMNIHSEKFKCTECGRCCHSSQHLAEHSRIHSRDKLYSCTQCEERFPYLSELSYHMNIHRYMPQYAQYACTACGKCFGDRADIAEHRQNNLAGNCLKVLLLIRDHPYARRSQC